MTQLPIECGTSSNRTKPNRASRRCELSQLCFIAAIIFWVLFWLQFTTLESAQCRVNRIYIEIDKLIYSQVNLKFFTPPGTIPDINRERDASIQFILHSLGVCVSVCVRSDFMDAKFSVASKSFKLLFTLAQLFLKIHFSLSD